MILTDLKQKIKFLLGLLDRRDVYMAILIVLTAIVAYILGILSGQSTEGVPVTVSNSASAVLANQVVPSGSKTPVSTATVSADKGVYVASKSGTKYHLPTCPGAQRIIETNKIWFTSKAEAEKAGYTPAANCPGI